MQLLKIISGFILFFSALEGGTYSMCQLDTHLLWLFPGIIVLMLGGCIGGIALIATTVAERKAEQRYLQAEANWMEPIREKDAYFGNR
jgi:hypothetical protein